MDVPVEITIRESQGYISGLPAWERPENAPDTWVDPLTMATSFRPVGFQFTKRYQAKKSDGRVKLLKHSKFPAGLLETVTKTLQKHQIEYHLTVEREDGHKGMLPPYVLVGVESRDYQDDAVEKALLHPRGVIRAPTGSGKTAIGTRVIVERGLYALVTVPTIDLLYQFKSFLEDHLVELSEEGPRPAQIGQLGDGVVDPQPITVATIRTAATALGVAYESYEYGEYDDADDTEVKLGRELREWIEQIGTVIVDEAHILGADSVFRLVTKIPAPNKYGFSASPWRDDGADLMIEAATGPVIYQIPVKRLVDGGHLVPPIVQVVDTKSWWTAASWGQTCTKCGAQRPMGVRGPADVCPECGGVRWRSEYNDAYREEIVENPIRNGRIAEIVQNLSGSSLVLVKQKKHGRLLQELLPGSIFLSGNDPGAERARVYDAMRTGRLDHLIATTIADMGLDLPVLQNLVLAGGGKSSTRHLQRVGRVARPFPGKTFARVVDFDDSHVHKWFREHARARRKIEKAEWGASALWI